MGSCVLLDDCIIVLETVTDDLSYQWHDSSCVLLVDCRVVSGLLDEDIVERYLPNEEGVLMFWYLWEELSSRQPFLEEKKIPKV
jgi:hypothetical protein